MQHKADTTLLVSVGAVFLHRKSLCVRTKNFVVLTPIVFISFFTVRVLLQHLADTSLSVYVFAIRSLIDYRATRVGLQTGVEGILSRLQMSMLFRNC